MEISGTIKAIMPVKETATFKSIEFVLNDNSNAQYPQYLPMQVSQGKCSLLDNVKEGDQVTVTANLKGREWQSPNDGVKYFLSLDVWKLNKLA